MTSEVIWFSASPTGAVGSPSPGAMGKVAKCKAGKAPKCVASSHPASSKHGAPGKAAKASGSGSQPSSLQVEVDKPVMEELLEGNSSPVADLASMGPPLKRVKKEAAQQPSSTIRRLHSYLQKCRQSADPAKQEVHSLYQQLDPALKKAYLEKWVLDKEDANLYLKQVKVKEHKLSKQRLVGWVTAFEVSRELGIPVNGDEMLALLASCPTRPHEEAAWKVPWHVHLHIYICLVLSCLLYLLCHRSV